MALEISGIQVQPGGGVGPLLVLDRPVSFWGGVDPESGRITDPRHPQHGTQIGGRVLAAESDPSGARLGRGELLVAEADDEMRGRQ